MMDTGYPVEVYPSDVLDGGDTDLTAQNAGITLVKLANRVWRDEPLTNDDVVFLSRVAHLFHAAVADAQNRAIDSDIARAEALAEEGPIQP